MKRNKHFRARVDPREFDLIKVILKQMYGKYSNAHDNEIINADELHIKVDNTL